METEYSQWEENEIRDENEAPETNRKRDGNEKREAYLEQHSDEHVIVSKVSYLTGVERKFFEMDTCGLDAEIFADLEQKREARIVRNLCAVRTCIELNFKKFSQAITFDFKNLHTLQETGEMIRSLRRDGIDFIKSNPQLNEYVPKINNILAQNIDACKYLFPIWVEWSYIRQLFLFPGSDKPEKMKKYFSYYMENLNSYPYRVFINWKFKESPAGNLFYNDEKFLALLYDQHGQIFIGRENVRGEGRADKRNIYDFVDASIKTVAIIDCENSDPLKACAAFQSLREETLAKITKVILINDANTSSAWGLLSRHIKAPIEHMMTERLMRAKSIVDGTLMVRCCKEHYVEQVDSFLLFSSDSDYWSLLTNLNTAKFLVMVEETKLGSGVLQKMVESNVPFCYLDKFYQGGQTYQMKVDALLSECERFVECRFTPFNAREMMNAAIGQTRLTLTEKETRQFYRRYLKAMKLKVDESGMVTLLFGE